MKKPLITILLLLFLPIAASAARYVWAGCKPAKKYDPRNVTRIKGLSRRSASRPHADLHSVLLHRALATASGAAGGTFGLAALPVELPVSTIIMLRSIADIARSEGEDLKDPATALACVKVFALGGRIGSTDASESGYFATRTVHAKTVTEG